MRRILSLIAVVALMLAFAMPVVTADAASHEKKMNPCNPCAAKKEMKANPCNPCAAKKEMKANPCNPCKVKNPCSNKKQ